MPRPSYHQQVRKQKERVRKARQEEKQQRRSARVNATDEMSGDTQASEFAAPGHSVPETTS